jgi:hypothetical protein
VISQDQLASPLKRRSALLFDINAAIRSGLAKGRTE